MQIHNSSLTRFGVGGEHDVESFDDHGFDVCSGQGSDKSQIEGSQDVGVLWDKVLGVLTGPDRTLVANHPHQRYDNKDNRNDDPNTNETNNRDPIFRSQPASILSGLWPGQWTPLDVPTSTEPQMAQMSRPVLFMVHARQI